MNNTDRGLPIIFKAIGTIKKINFLDAAKIDIFNERFEERKTFIELSEKRANKIKNKTR